MLGVAEVESQLEDMIAHVGERYHEPYLPTHARRKLEEALSQLRSKLYSPSVLDERKKADLISSLNSDNIEIRRAACYKAAECSGPEIVQALIRTLERFSEPQYNQAEDLYQCTRKGAAFALGKLGDPLSEPALLRASMDDAPWEVTHGGLRRRYDMPKRYELAMPVFGASVREGLREAGTPFAERVLEKAGPLTPTAPDNIRERAQSSDLGNPITVREHPQGVRKWWRFWT
jgi:hypothetical protein